MAEPMPRNVPSLQDAAAALLKQAEQLPPREPGERLRSSDELRILVMVRERGHSQEDAAAAVGCHQSTVSRVLEKYDDTRPLARKRLEAAAVEVAERAIREGDPLKLLAKLDVVRDDKADIRSAGVLIVGHPIPIEPRAAGMPLLAQPVARNLGTGADLTAADLEEHHARGGLTVLIGTPPPGTPHNPIMVGRGRTDDAA
jgi:hypothetical protein